MRSSKNKIQSPKKLALTLKKLRKNSTLVFTNGCFDILHAGHVTYLEKARSFGDLLVVALNTDESVKKLKGPTRPVNPLQDRMRVLAGLECVDYVTWFSEDTPLNLIVKLAPHLLVKGGDYNAKEVVGYTEMKSWGGKVKIVPLLKGRSTTKIISAAKGSK